MDGEPDGSMMVFALGTNGTLTSARWWHRQARATVTFQELRERQVDATR